MILVPARETEDCHPGSEALLADLALGGGHRPRGMRSLQPPQLARVQAPLHVVLIELEHLFIGHGRVH
eukprot:CAMPEP_0182908426 /NCGR_PEP_ID=MMETSP0034_2-20130328/35207_1 /TAXON_ID=156128 /ORGANISM="Nephroselmis pyriformis, Strain CCMP717" /LENGTH=67 /DNA_ID=CAMNT_0025044607 /DNA_START=78 /DNA_END=278 /DNA_ORIENTATION=-